MKIHRAAILLGICVHFSPTFAVDLSSCEDSLSRLKRSVSDGEDAANNASSKVEEATRCKDDRFGYDYKYDQCRGKSDDARNAINDLKSALDDVDYKVKRVSMDCGYEVGTRNYGATQQDSTATGDEHCDVYRGYLGKLPYENLMKICTQYQSADQCKKCFEFKLKNK
jgi:hypothetical protein